MCGIAGIISKKQVDHRRSIAAMSAAIAHRGPDGEGFLVYDLHEVSPCFRDEKPDNSSGLNYLPGIRLQDVTTRPVVLFAHRRLSIIDLSSAGHEPMCDRSGKIWITFNGEIYNYEALRKQLVVAGYTFRSNCDTEVIINAYLLWGEKCVEKFNGMWAFCILDTIKKQCFASRDRFGVKPFYYSDNNDHFAFASEQKAFIKSELLKARADDAALHNYLVNGLLETSTSNFFKGINELWPGHNLLYDLKSHKTRIEKYFDLQQEVSLSNDTLTDHEIIAQARFLFEESVRLRMRSDVEVGTCLSGGIDSSAIAVTIAKMSGKPLHCFTASFKNQPFDESFYAKLVADQIGAIHHITEPGEHELMRDFDDLIYSQDVPIWDTSTYAQYRVMGLAKRNRIKVVLDGQGADELFTGYHHHFTAKWNDLLSHGKFPAFVKQLRESKVSLSAPFVFYAKEKFKATGLLQRPELALLKKEFVESHNKINPFQYRKSVNAQLIDDITRTRLKTFLKCEDRCGMWHGVESRTPFSDDKDLIAFMFSFDGNRKIQHGRLKFFLREAVRQDLPPMVYNRFDKRGFETPMLQWIGNINKQMTAEVREAGFEFVNPHQLGQAKSPAAQRLLFKLFVLARWKKVFNA